MIGGRYPVAILAGGRATRLRPLTETIPKALIELAGEPFIAHQLKLLSAAGVGRVVVCAGFLGKMIRDFVGDGGRYGLEVEFVFDGDRLLGTAGAVRRALPRLGPAFFVMYGDSYLTCDFGQVQRGFDSSGKLGLMTVYLNEGLYDRSNVEYRDGEILVYDKEARAPAMRHIDYGLGLFRAEAFDLVPEGQSYDLARLYQQLLARGELAACEVGERFYEIGSFEGLEDTRRYLEQRSGARRGGAMSFADQYLDEAKQVIDQLDRAAIERVVAELAAVRRRGGRLFILGVGGSAANASHAVNDFRKIAGIESYAPTDNVSELTARVNDEGWASVFVEWLKTSRLRAEDLVLVFSVGGGSLEKNVSPNLVAALSRAREVGTPVIGVVGRDGGYTAQVATACVVIPTVNPAATTPHTEAFQGLVWHLLVSHPELKVAQTKWESVK